MKNVFDYLQKINIQIDVHNHPAVLTVDEARKYRINETFSESKNLFLRNKKGTKHYLVTIDANKNLDIKKLAETLDIGRLGFASDERLEKYLGLKTGAVSPFGLINDQESEVIFVIDNDLFKNKKLGFHPNINTQTIIISREDFEKYLSSLKNEIVKMKL